MQSKKLLFNQILTILIAKKLVLILAIFLSLFMLIIKIIPKIIFFIKNSTIVLATINNFKITFYYKILIFSINIFLLLEYILYIYNLE